MFQGSFKGFKEVLFCNFCSCMAAIVETPAEGVDVLVGGSIGFMF